MGSVRIRMGIFGASLALGLALLLVVFHPRLAPIRRAILALQSRGHATAAGAASPIAPAAPAAAAQGRSQLAEDLNSPTGDIHADLRLVNEIFIAFRGALHSGNPVGENVEITAALKGRNKLGFAFIPPDCPAINARGELCDRWGSPFFFHQLSGEKMEIRSAGPDRVLWTADDQVLTP
jgi:hypothetical protein